MIGLGMLAIRYLHLRGVVLAIWSALHVVSPDAPVIADAIAGAVADDPAPVWDAETETAALAVWVYYESAVRLHPVPYVDPGTGLAIDGKAHGSFQLHGLSGRTNIVTQARAFVALLHEGQHICPGNPIAPPLGGCRQAARPAARRLALARRLLSATTEEQLANE